MNHDNVAIIGFGAVGRHMHRLFPEAVVYDEPLGLGVRADVNSCDYAFVAVPTPSDPTGRCDTAIVEEVVAWLTVPCIVIRSTVAVGTTERLRERTGKRIVFQPEYGPGETPDHPYADPFSVRWVILGGRPTDTAAVADLYKDVYSAELSIHQTDATTAELVKYMENAFLAVKVTFCNEFFEVAHRLDVDYNDLRELWLLDPRVGRSHTFVKPRERGFGGRCLPKDLNAIIQSAADVGFDASLLRATLAANAAHRADLASVAR